jgi:hypothetical protein
MLFMPQSYHKVWGKSTAKENIFLESDNLLEGVQVVLDYYPPCPIIIFKEIRIL